MTSSETSRVRSARLELLFLRTVFRGPIGTLPRPAGQACAAPLIAEYTVWASAAIQARPTCRQTVRACAVLRRPKSRLDFHGLPECSPVGG